MTRTQLILSHASVFGVGIAAAWLGIGLRQPAEQADADSNSTNQNRRSSHSASGFSSVGERGLSASKRAGSQNASGKAAVDRLTELVRITDTLERQKAMMSFIEKLDPKDFEAVAAQYRNLDHLTDGGGEFNIILRSWAKADPLKALDWISQFPNSRNNSAAVLSTWAGADPAAAVKWATDHHEGDGANPYMPSVIRGIAATDLGEASKLAQAMPNSRERGEAVDAITQALFFQGPEAALAFPQTIQDEALRGGFVAAIADKLVAKDPTKAAAWIASLGQGDIQNRAARNVGSALARQDIAEAAAWVKSLKPEAQVEAARGVIPIMSSADIAGTAKWVSSLAGTPNYDRAVEEFVWSCNTRAPEQSAAWIMGVSNPDQQRKLYHRMLGEWAQKDSAAVKQWVATNNVPDDIRKRFLR